MGDLGTATGIQGLGHAGAAAAHGEHAAGGGDVEPAAGLAADLLDGEGVLVHRASIDLGRAGKADDRSRSAAVTLIATGGAEARGRDAAVEGEHRSGGEQHCQAKKIANRLRGAAHE